MELLTVRQVATALQVNPDTVRRWIRKGQLEAKTLPGDTNHPVYRIVRDALYRAIENTTTPTN